MQRFEFSFEATWKAAQAYLREREAIDAPSPKAVIRGAHRVGLLTEAETQLALTLADDRNRTSHTYNEAFVAALFGRLDAYAALLDRWLVAMTAEQS